MPCRINRSRLWTHRMMLEALGHESNCFVTLTYDEEHLPKDGSLVKKHYQDWLKRMRSEVAPDTFRYFLVGEYGDKSWRPHYHAALFGIGVDDAELIQDTWGHGFTMTGELNKDSASYIAGYVTKKLTNGKDEKVKSILAGRLPEFARMSLKPGIGALAIRNILDALTSEHGWLAMTGGDVPMSLRHGTRDMPLGRYLRSKLRLAYGFGDGKTPQEGLHEFAEKMRTLFQDCKANPKLRKKTYKEMIVAKNEQLVRNLEGKMNLYKKRKVI